MMLSRKVGSRTIINGGVAAIAMSMVFVVLLTVESVPFITLYWGTAISISQSKIKDVFLDFLDNLF